MTESVHAQKYKGPDIKEPSNYTPMNSFYIELLGNAGYYSLNYERMILDGSYLSLRSRVGLSFFPGYFAFPVLLQGDVLFSQGLAAELGAGGIFEYQDQDGVRLSGYTGVLGIRYTTPFDLLFRFSFTPRLDPDTPNGPLFQPWIGGSVGISF